MSIAVVCPECSAKLNAPDSAAGKRVKCPKCQTGITVPAAVAEEAAFEEVVDEPAPQPKPRPKARAIADNDDDVEKPRKRRVEPEVEDDDADDDRPRKKRKRAADEDASGSRMTRNIIGGVVLLILLGVAGWVYYDKYGKPPREIIVERTPEAEAPAVFMPPPKNGPAGAGVPGGGGGDRPTVWTPDANLVGQLTQKAEVDGYQISLPQAVTTLPPPGNLPDSIKIGTWVANSGGAPTGIVSLTVISDAQTVAEAGRNMRQTLDGLTTGFASTSKFKIASRGPTETGLVNGLRFTRFSITGTGSNQVDLRGFVYGAVDGERFVTIVATGFGPTAEGETRLLESVIATIKKR